MKLLAFSVRDGAVEAFMTPFFARAEGEAVRSFLQACSNPEHAFAKSASDYVLFRVGSFDDNGGVFTPIEPVRLMSAFEAIASSRSDPLG